MGRQPGKICVTLSLPKRILASLQLFCEFTYNNLSSTNSTCAQPCYCQSVETHSCVSASCQVFATGDFIRQFCLPRRKNASLQVFTEFTYNRIVKRASKRSNKSSVETWRAASPPTRAEQTREVHLLPRDGHSRKTSNCQGTTGLAQKDFANKKPVPLAFHTKINANKSSKMADDE